MKFNLEEEITQWKKDLSSNPELEPGDIEELEIHLRDSIEDRANELSEKEAFDKMINDRFGDLKSITKEYRKSRLKSEVNPKWTDSFNPLNLLPHNIKLAFRNLSRNVESSLINIAGLTISIAAGIMIFQYVNFENSHDQFFADKERIFRIAGQSFNTNTNILRGKYATTIYAVSDDIKAEVPEIEATTRLVQIQGNFNVGENQFRENDIFFTYSDFFDIFSIPLIYGNKKELDQPNVLFLSRAMAQKYFDDENPVGKTIEIALLGIQEVNYKVGGVFEDIPDYSHLKIDALLSHANYIKNFNDNNTSGRTLDEIRWRLVGFYQYVKFKEHTDLSRIQPKLDALMEKYRGDIDRARNVKNEFFMVNLGNIHLSEMLTNELRPKGDPTIILFLKIILLTIMLLGWINYINLTTARSINRAKEVGVRKVIGSTRYQLFIKFITESLIINIISLVLAIVLIFMTVPYYHELIGKEVFNYLDVTWTAWIYFALILVGGILLSSIYPALVLSSFKPISILKGKFKNSTRGILIRRSLVGFQFCVSLILLTSIYILYEQISYMKNHELGFDINQTLVVQGPSAGDSISNNKIKVLRDLYETEGGFEQVTLSNAVPGTDLRYRNAARHIRGNYKGEDLFIRRIIGFHNYYDFFDFELLAGRKLYKDRQMDDNAVLLNRKATELFGFKTPEEAINEQVAFLMSDTMRIVGVVENFAQRGLQVAYEPMSIEMDNTGFALFLSIKIPSENVDASIATAGEMFSRFFPRDPFEYFILDDRFDKQYQSEEKYGKILGLFTFIAIVIAGLGLLGLTAFMVRLKMKEIAIRKVLGGSLGHILTILFKEYLYLIAIACLIGIPVAYYCGQLWLETFAFKINLHPLLFVVPILAIILITIASIGRLCYRAALSNPAESLVDE